MDDYVCDDRFDFEEHAKKICSMTDEEFEKYTIELEEKENQNT